MVLGENFDELLWLMMAGDEKNREKLAYFIKIIPKEIYDQINKVIDYNNNGHIRSRFVDSDGFVYEYEFKFDGCFCLTIWRFKGCYVEEKFRLSLSANTVNILNNMTNFERIYVGSFYCNSKSFQNSSQNPEFIHVDKEYYLVKTPIGYILESSDMYDFKMKMVSYRKKCPSEMYVTDFSTPDRVNYLVKARKRINRNLELFK